MPDFILASPVVAEEKTNKQTPFNRSFVYSPLRHYISGCCRQCSEGARRLREMPHFRDPRSLHEVAQHLVFCHVPRFFLFSQNSALPKQFTLRERCTLTPDQQLSSITPCDDKTSFSGFAIKDTITTDDLHDICRSHRAVRARVTKHQLYFKHQGCWKEKGTRWRESGSMIDTLSDLVTS